MGINHWLWQISNKIKWIAAVVCQQFDQVLSRDNIMMNILDSTAFFVMDDLNNGIIQWMILYTFSGASDCWQLPSTDICFLSGGQRIWLNPSHQHLQFTVLCNFLLATLFSSVFFFCFCRMVFIGVAYSQGVSLQFYRESWQTFEGNVQILLLFLSFSFFL